MGRVECFDVGYDLLSPSATCCSCIYIKLQLFVQTPGNYTSTDIYKHAVQQVYTGRARLIQSHSATRFFLPIKSKFKLTSYVDKMQIRSKQKLSTTKNSEFEISRK